MANITITNNDNGSVIVEQGSFEDGVLSLSGGGTVKEGTLLARHASSGAFLCYATSGSDDVDEVKAILTHEVTVPAGGSLPIQAMISGKVNSNRIVIHADGDNSNVTPAILDELRDYGIVPTDVKQLAQLDNQGEDS